MPLCTAAQANLGEVLWPIVGIAIGAILTMIANYLSSRMSYSHRVLVEKEYALYVEIWDKLFSANRAIAQLDSGVSSGNIVQYSEKETLDFFNAYQAVIRRNEPFMNTSIFEPARAIVKLMSSIIAATGKQKELSSRLDRTHHESQEERLVNRQIELDDEVASALQKIEKLTALTCAKIRARVAP